MKHLVNKPMTKKVKFMGEDLEVRKLSVGQVIEIQQMSKAIGDDEKASLELLQYVISSAVKDAKDLTPDDFMEFPIDELSKLSNEILSYSGLGNVQQK
jgi:hypothetical protein